MIRDRNCMTKRVRFKYLIIYLFMYIYYPLVSLDFRIDIKFIVYVFYPGPGHKFLHCIVNRSMLL